MKGVKANPESPRGALAVREIRSIFDVMKNIQSVMVAFDESRIDDVEARVYRGLMSNYIGAAKLTIEYARLTGRLAQAASQMPNMEITADAGNQ
jgi:hypothetical protein